MPSRVPREQAPAGSATRLFGRDQELTQLRTWLRQGARLVTITGEGGVGKTALLRSVVELERRGFARHGGGGVVWLEVAELGCGDDLIALMAAQLRLRQGESELAASVERALARRGRSLLAVDNLEHLLEPASRVLARWLLVAPELQVLATSRAPLLVAGQQCLPLTPLAVPAIDASPDELRASPAWAMLATRLGQQLGPGLAVDDEAGALAEIVRRVEGVPLAIELAAARLRVAAPRELLRQLDDPLAALQRAGGGRHRSMRAVIQASVAALSPAARAAFAALAVFRGGLDVDAFGAVTGGDAAAALGELLDGGLVRRARLPRGGWGPLEVPALVGHAAGELLDEAGGRERAERAHAAWFAARARALRAAWLDAPSATLPHLAASELNLHAAARVALAVGDDAAAAALVLALDPLWAARGQHQARLDVLRELAAAPTSLPVDVVAELRIAHGSAARERGDLALAGELLQAVEAATPASRAGVIALARRAELLEVAGQTAGAGALLAAAVERADELGDAPGHEVARGEALARRGHVRRREGDMDGAAADLARAAMHFATGGDHEGLAVVAYERGVVAMFRGQVAAAQAAFDDALTGARACGASLMVAATQLAQGIMAQARGELDAAIALAATAAQAFADMGHAHRAGSALYTLASAYLERGEIDQARVTAAAALRALKAVHVPRYLALLHALAALAADAAEDPTAARASLERAAAMARACTREPAIAVVLELTTAWLAVPPRDRADAALRAAQATRAACVTTDDVALFYRLTGGGTAAHAAAAVLVLGATGVVTLVRGSARTPIDVARRPQLRRLLGTLATARRDAPGQPQRASALVAAAWPDERILPHAASNRLHVALSTLRRLGLRDVILSAPGGYLIDPAVAVSDG